MNQDDWLHALRVQASIALSLCTERPLGVRCKVDAETKVRDFPLGDYAAILCLPSLSCKCPGAPNGRKKGPTDLRPLWSSSYSNYAPNAEEAGSGDQAQAKDSPTGRRTPSSGPGITLEGFPYFL